MRTGTRPVPTRAWQDYFRDNHVQCSSEVSCRFLESGRRNSGLSPSAMCATAAGQLPAPESPRRVPAPARRCGPTTPQFSPMRLLSSLKNVFDSTCRTPQANVLGINQKTSLKRKLNNTTVLKAIFVRSRTRVLRGRSKFFKKKCRNFFCF